MPAVRLVDNQLTTFRIESRHPQWRLWLLLTTWLLLVMAGVERYLHWYTLNAIIPAYTEVDAHGIVHQSTDFTCVPAALTTLLRQQGIKAEQREVTQRLGTTVFGTWPEMIPRAGRHYGFQVTRERLDFAALCAAEDPLLLHNRYAEGLHVNYIPPGRLTPQFAAVLFPGHPGPFLPVMDPVDGLVLLDQQGFAEYFHGGGAKTVFRFRHPGEEPQAFDLAAAFRKGKLPLLKLGPELDGDDVLATGSSR